MVNLFMDDLRVCPKAPRWLLAKTADEALEIMELHRGNINLLSLDHDLGSKHKPERHGKWFVNNMIDRGLYANVIYLHTSNGEGRKNMFSYLLQAREMGILPNHVKIHNSPMPYFNLETGEYIYD